VSRLLAALVLITVAASGNARIVNLAPERGRAVASINWTDENGRIRPLSDLSGYPLILLPIYTRCRGACMQNVDRLKDALANSSSDPRQFRILLFSFDPTDSPATLANYRQREKIPLGWSIGTAPQPSIEALLESIGIQVGKAGTEFTHPNLVVFLDPKLRVAKGIYGTDYSNADIDRALQIAAGRSDWIGRHSDVLYAVLLFAATLLCVALFQHIFSYHRARA
jgi:cytochrome oxidase Cu insertion factor (SCO1/SenC/PrrC family)